MEEALVNERYQPSLLVFLILGLALGVSIWFTIFLVENGALFTASSEDRFWDILILLVVFSPAVIMTWAVTREYSARYTETGISRWSLLCQETIQWSEVQQVERNLYLLVLKAHKKKFQIHLLMYRDPDAMLSYVVRQIEKAHA